MNNLKRTFNYEKKLHTLVAQNMSKEYQETIELKKLKNVRWWIIIMLFIVTANLLEEYIVDPDHGTVIHLFDWFITFVLILILLGSKFVNIKYIYIGILLLQVRYILAFF